MSSTSKSAPRLAGVASLLLCSVMAACGGGGGGSGSVDTGTGTGTSTPPGGSSAIGGDSAASGSASSSAGGSTGSSSSGTAPTGADGVAIADATGTMRALSASAMLSLGLPVTLGSAPALAGSSMHVYHVDSANGADTNDGLAATMANGSGPWRTLARLAAASLVAGDRIELACGSLWHETLRIPVDGAAGAPIVVARPDGCSAPPAIDGSVALAPSAWTPYKGNIYKAPLAATPLQLFASSGAFTIAHFPNAGEVAADPGSPYLALAADSNATVLTTGSDFTLPAGATLDASARVRVRTAAWLLEDLPVASFDGKHITLATAPAYTVRSGWGYFLTGQLWMLRGPGQWWYDATARQVYAWMPDSGAPSAAVGASTLPAGIDLQGRSHVVIDGIAVRGTGLGVDARSTTDVSLRNMLIEDIADVGIDVAGSSHDVVESDGVARTGGDAVTGWGGAMGPLLNDATGLTARNNVIRDSGVLMSGDQVLSLPRRSLAALFTGSNATATANVIVNSGYIGILAQPGSTVSDNFIYGACSVEDDCGAIYTGGANNGAQIVGNTVVHARGSIFGQPVGNRATAAQGIYVDDKGSGILIQANTVIDADHGIQLHNAARNTVQSNRLFANRIGQLWMQENTNELDPNGDMSGNVIDGNEIAPISPAAGGLQLSTSFASTERFGSFVDNRFYDRVAPWVTVNSTASTTRGLTFGDWHGSTGYGSTQPADPQGAAVSTAGYAVYTPSGGNLVPNGALATDSAGWSSWNATAPSGQATRTLCPAGACMQYVAGGSPGILSSPGFALQQGAWYRLTVDVSTQTDNQLVPLIVRVGSGDYASVSDRSLAFTAGRTWTRHAVVFQATRTLTGTGARIDLDSIVAGRSIEIANLEIVQVVPSTIAQNSSVIVNAAATPLSASCPFATNSTALCSQAFDLATARPVSWPLTVAARSAVIVYTQDPALVDSDGDGIPDAYDSCPGTPVGVAVNGAGCPLTVK